MSPTYRMIHRVRLTDKQKETIRDLDRRRKAGEDIPMSGICVRFGVSSEQIRKVLREKKK